MIEHYPMRSYDEACASIQRAVADRHALRITPAEFDAVKGEYYRRFNQIKKAALLAGAAKVVRREPIPSAPQSKPRRPSR